MKKISMLIISMAMLFSLSACTDKSEGGNDTGTTTENENSGKVTTDELGTTVRAVMTIKGFGDITFELYPDIAPLAVERFKQNAESGYFENKIFHRIVQNFMIQGGSADGTGASGSSENSYQVERNMNARHYYGALCVATNSFGESGDQFYIVSSKNTETFNEDVESLQDIKDSLEVIKGNIATLENWIANPEEAELDSASIEYYYKTYKNSIKYYTAKIEMIENATPDIGAKYAEVGGAAFLDGGYTVMGQTVDGFDVLDKIAAVPVSLNSQSEESLPDEDVIIEKVVILG